MPEKLPATKTACTPTELGDALVRAWRAIQDEEPSRDAILVLLAHVRLECGWDAATGKFKACHAWNLGNAKHAENDGRDWCEYACDEIINGERVWFEPPHPACRFRAYRTLAEGAADYLALLRKRFSGAWGRVVAGDPSGFVRALKARGYFTADLEPYERAVVSIFEDWKARLDFDVSPEDSIDDATRERALALVASNLGAEFEVTISSRDQRNSDPTG